MIYGFISCQKADFKVSTLCRVCKVPRQSYYSWSRSESSRQIKLTKDTDLKTKIKTIYDSSRKNYGCPKIHASLRSEGIHISKKKVAKLMVELGIAGRCLRKKIKTTNRDKLALTSPDLLNRNFSVEVPNETFVTDITYIATKEGWLYLVAILDLCTRVIVGFSMDRNMDKQLCINALDSLKLRGINLNGSKLHSDHGSQFTSNEFREKTVELGLIQSMGSVGDSYDNSPAENLWSLLKRESDFKDVFETIQEARTSVFSWINWYNNERIHSSIGYMTPCEFETLELEKIK